ncbi:hypothetical protein ACTXT7_000149 [Hymenolepis weldensis]
MFFIREAQIITVLATRLPNYADMEVQTSLVMRNTFTQMNFLTSTKDHKDCMKDVKLCNMPLDPVDLAHEEMVNKLGLGVSDNISLFNLAIREDQNVHYRKTNSDAPFLFLVSYLLATLRFDSDFCPSWTRSLVKKSSCGSEAATGTYHLSTKETHSPSDNHPTNIRSNYPSEDVTVKTATRIFYRRFNEAEPKQKESVNSDKAKL